MDHRDKPGDDEVIENNKIHPSAHKVAKTSVSWTIFSVKMRGYLSFTPVNIRTLFEKNKQTGECGAGLYVWAQAMILVEVLDRPTIESTIESLLAAGEFDGAFRQIN